MVREISAVSGEIDTTVTIHPSPAARDHASEKQASQNRTDSDTSSPNPPPVGGTASVTREPSARGLPSRISPLDLKETKNRSIERNARLEDVGSSDSQTTNPDLSPLDENESVLDMSWRWHAWLVSTIIHLIVLICLLLWTYQLSGTRNGESLEGRMAGEGPIIELQAVELDNTTVDFQVSQAERPVEVDLSPNEESDVAQSVVLQTEAVPMEPDTVSLMKSGGQSNKPNRLTILPGGGLGGRTPEGRKINGDKYGATGASEQAVENALRWLAEHQRDDGSWSFNLTLDPCGGRCSHSKKSGDTPTPSTGATGLALLAFLGAGYTHQSGKYADTVRRGIYYLRSVAAESEFGYDWQQGSMYGHGIALLALGEALAMTENEGKYDSDLMRLVERGSYFTCTAQHPSGSWGYNPGSPGDTTLTGWQVLSLVGAKRCGIDLRTTTLPRAKEFLLSVKHEHSYDFGYRKPEPEQTTTAIGLLLMMYLGQTPGYTPFDNAVYELADRGPTLTNVYHDYYATMALHHLRHPEWDKWNTKLRDHLVRTQANSGHESGSWHFKDRWGDVGGRLYTTAMCTLTLEVYYRYLPMYEKPEKFPL